MVEKILQEKYTGFQKERAEREPVDLPDPPS
jgi:hypothetical protein